MRTLAGIDRWRGGWIVACESGSSVELSIASHIDTVAEELAGYDVVAIDMPIALATHGTRDAEAQVRKVLGSSARSVFTSPTRAAVEALTQSEATEMNRANGGPGISAQAFGLFASIRELREHLAGLAVWWETHPETAFALMNDGVPLASKRSALGVAERLKHLRQPFPQLDELLLTSPAKVPVDDVLDALAALWSARRIYDGGAALFGCSGHDDQGFPVGIRI